MLIIGSRVNESYDASPGHIRALRHGDRADEMDLPHDSAATGSSATTRGSGSKGENYGGANAWGGVTIDEQRGWVFAATGSATEDFYGGFRKGDEPVRQQRAGARCDDRRAQVALPDRPPRHLGLRQSAGADPGHAADRHGTSQDAVVQLTKMGLTFVLDRDTGQPLFPVHDVPVPRSTVPGRRDVRRRSRSRSSRRRSCARSLTEADLTNITPEARAYALKEFRKYRSGLDLHAAEPAGHDHACPAISGAPSGTARRSIRVLNVLYVNVNEAPTINRLRPVHDSARRRRGEPPIAAAAAQIYERTCAACHGAERQGTPPHTPALVDTEADAAGNRDRRSRRGATSMPAFRQFRPRELSALVAYLASRRRETVQPARARRAAPIATRSTATRVPRSARRAGHRAALGHAERDRSRQGRDPLEGPARRVPAARREGHPQHRHA